MVRFDKKQVALNAICPYFTMFPLEFPLRILSRHANANDNVLDPFCGRGTTNFAARLLGLRTVGIDSSPIAAAITASKLVNVDPKEISEEALLILKEKHFADRPSGEFWRWAFHEKALDAICRLRAALLDDCSSPARIALRGILLGALHGPRQIGTHSYFSNQCPRTYAPKPRYALRFWKTHSLRPVEVDVAALIDRRAKRYFSSSHKTSGQVRLADSRKRCAFERLATAAKFEWVITSPPYYGMRTYIPDQWLRYWFLGGPDEVDYTSHGQVTHSSPVDFADDVRKVWKNAAAVSSESATLVVRFGGISDRRADPKEVIRESFVDSGWAVSTIKSAGTASFGKRQADTFLRRKSRPLDEYVVWAKRQSR